MTHGQQEPFDDWLNDELSSHGDNITLQDWGQHELDSHYERYGAEGDPKVRRLKTIAKWINDNHGDTHFADIRDTQYGYYNAFNQYITKDGKKLVVYELTPKGEYPRREVFSHNPLEPYRKNKEVESWVKSTFTSPVTLRHGAESFGADFKVGIDGDFDGHEEGDVGSEHIVTYTLDNGEKVEVFEGYTLMSKDGMNSGKRIDGYLIGIKDDNQWWQPEGGVPTRSEINAVFGAESFGAEYARGYRLKTNPRSSPRASALDSRTRRNISKNASLTPAILGSIAVFGTGLWLLSNRDSEIKET